MALGSLVNAKLPGVNPGDAKITKGIGLIPSLQRPTSKGQFVPGAIQTIPRQPGLAQKILGGGTTSAAGTVAPAGATAPVQPPSPFDATYFANVGAHQLGTNNQINGLNLQGSQDQVAMQTALAQLGYQQPRDQLKLEQAANNAGGLYSSAYDQNLGNLNYQYAGRQGAAQNNYANQLATIAARIAGLQSGETAFEGQQAAASTARLAALAAKDPAIGMGTGGLNTALQPGTTSPAPGAANGKVTAPRSNLKISGGKPGPFVQGADNRKLPASRNQKISVFRSR